MNNKIKCPCCGKYFIGKNFNEEDSLAEVLETSHEIELANSKKKKKSKK